MKTMSDVHILGIPMYLGAGTWGADMGPSALRLAKLAPTLRALGRTVHDLGNVDIPVHEVMPDTNGFVHAPTVADACRTAYEKFVNLPNDGFGIALGGDHSISIGSIAGFANGDKNMGMVWVDAHADINTPDTSPSGNVHGMPVAHLLGLGHEMFTSIWGGGAVLKPENIVMIGLRDLDPAERDRIHELDILAYTMKDIDRLGMGRVADETLERVSNCSKVHVSLDADALDPSVTPGTGTPVPGGLTYREAHLLMELLADSGLVKSMDIVEVNPILDHTNRTAKVLVELTASLLGRRIL